MKNLLKAFIPMAVALVSLTPSLFGQDLDFRALDKLGASAKSTTNVTLAGPMLKFAAAVLGNGNNPDAASLKSLIANLRAVSVRVYKFDRPGMYSEADLAPLRATLSQSKWTAVVDVKEGSASNQIYFASGPSNKLGGVAVVSMEPTSLTLVYIDGELDPSDVAKLSGNMGIPDIKSLGDLKGFATRPENKADNGDSKGKK